MYNNNNHNPQHNPQPDFDDIPQYSTNPLHIAEQLLHDWNPTFNKPDPTMPPHDFLECSRGFATCSLEQLRPSSGQIERIFDNLKDSAPGPDGIIYTSYKPLLRYIVPLLQVFISYLFAGGHLHPCLLLAFMVFLPKKKYTLSPTGQRIYKSMDVRPLSLSNTFVKLIAVSLKISLCSVIDSKIHRNQKCVAGRNLLDNVISIDACMHSFALQEKLLAAGIFLDFTAAFPSIAHQFLWRVLIYAGIPIQFIVAIKRLYEHNVHFIKIGGRLFAGPSVCSGTKQGCPLSMALFAMCLHALLMHLQRIAGNNDITGAFADDLAMVIEDITKVLAPIAHLFEEFEGISGLALNHPKCAIIPLCPPHKVPQFTDAFIAYVNRWKDFPIKLHTEYLGFELGPEAHEHQWSSPLRKALDSAAIWSKLHAGFLLNLLAMNTYILPFFFSSIKLNLLSTLRKLTKSFHSVKTSFLWALEAGSLQRSYTTYNYSAFQPNFATHKLPPPPHKYE